MRVMTSRQAHMLMRKIKNPVSIGFVDSSIPLGKSQSITKLQMYGKNLVAEIQSYSIESKFHMAQRHREKSKATFSNENILLLLGKKSLSKVTTTSINTF